MEKNILPKHQQYKNGVLTFVFDEKMPTVLNKIDFVIDKKPYYINLMRLQHQSLTWIFQKPTTLNALSREEIDKILLLSSDVIKGLTFVRRPKTFLRFYLAKQKFI